jgi:hypothetical protein
MSEPEHGDGPPNDPETAFDRLERQRETMELLGQETRHAIVQTILAHPDGLASQAELCNVQAGKSRKAVTDQITRLVESGLIAEYHHEPNESVRGEPANFYGLTVEGARTLGNLGYFEAAPMMRAVYARMRKDERIQRHENADRPTLPEKVRYALRLGEYDDSSDGSSDESSGGHSQGLGKVNFFQHDLGDISDEAPTFTQIEEIEDIDGEIHGNRRDIERASERPDPTADPTEQ